MRAAEARAVMGAPKATRTDPDGNLRMLWYDAGSGAGGSESGEGLYAVATRSADATVLRVVVHDDPRYATARGLHTGVGEQQVVAAMGPPSTVQPLARSGHRLVYEAQGIWFAVIDNPAVRGYGAVGEIGVFKPDAGRAARLPRGGGPAPASPVIHQSSRQP
jgi:hypothetical protein